MRAYFLFLSLFCGLLLSLGVPAQGALVWTKDKGWAIEGGVLSEFVTLSQEENTNAVSLMNRARTAQEKDAESGSALGYYLDVVSDYPQSVYAPEAVFQRALIYRARGQYSAAYSTFKKLTEDYPNYDRFNQMIAAIYGTAEDVQQGKTFYMWGSIPWFSDPRVAIDLYEMVIAQAPFSDFAPLALMNIALISNERGKPEDAIDALDRLANNYPGSTVTGDAYVQMADTYASLVMGADYDQGATRQALSYYQDYLLLFPNGPEAARARAGAERMSDMLAQSKFDIGYFYYRYRNDPDAASVFFGEAITEAPLSPSAQRARAELENIEKGIKAPRTPLDWLLGRYPAPKRYDGIAADVYEGSIDDPFLTLSPSRDESNVQRATEAQAALKSEKLRNEQASEHKPLPAKKAPKPQPQSQAEAPAAQADSKPASDAAAATPAAAPAGEVPQFKPVSASEAVSADPAAAVPATAEEPVKGTAAATAADAAATPASAPASSQQQ